MKHPKQALRVYRHKDSALARRVEQAVNVITLAASGLGILSAVVFLLTM